MIVPVEIINFLPFFGMALGDSVTSNLLIFRSCYVLLGYNKSECEQLGTGNTSNRTNDLEILSEPYATNISMILTFIVAISNSIVCLFIGPWSDLFGRKPILVYCLVGTALQYSTTAIFTLLPNISPWFILFTDIPKFFSGGIFSLVAMVFTITSDITSLEKRGFRMSLVQAAMYLAYCCGPILGPYLLYATSYFTVYICSFLLILLDILLIIFFLPETKKFDGNEKESITLKKLFNFSHVKDMFKTVIKKRDHFDRIIIIISILLSAITITVVMGQISVLSYFLRAKFGWALKKVSLYSSISSCLAAVGVALPALIFQKYLKIPETVIILIALIGGLVGYIMQGLAESDTLIWIAMVLFCFAGVTPVVIKSIASKLVSSDELGKLFAVIVTIESLFQLSSSPLYTQIYNFTLNEDPGFFNYVSAGFNVLLIVLIIGISIPYGFKMEKCDKKFPLENKL